MQSGNISWKEAFFYSWNITKLIFYRPEFLVSALACATLVALSGIFMPFAAVDPVQRMSIVGFSIVIGSAISFILHFFAQPLHIKWGVNLWTITFVTSIGCALVFSILIPGISPYLFTYPPPGFAELFVPISVLYILIDTFIFWRIKPYICRDQYKSQIESQHITAFLPLQTRGTLMAISAADHYVEISTDKGKHMLRMSMKLAISKTGEDEGMRVHRSHWVAYSAVVSLGKLGERHFLTLRGGQNVPVSPTYIDAVRQIFAPKGLTTQ